MTAYWATEELPAYAWDSDQPPPDDRRLTDLWGQHLTTTAADAITTIEITGEYL